MKSGTMTLYPAWVRLGTMCLYSGHMPNVHILQKFTTRGGIHQDFSWLTCRRPELQYDRLRICNHSQASLNKNLTALNVNINSFSNFNGVKSKPLTAGVNLTALSVNGLKMTSVRCPLNVNDLKCL
jgi:hypothetical protein